MSGIVQRIVAQGDGNEVRVGIRNVTIRIRQNEVTRTAMTNDDGSFIIPDVQPSARLTFEVDGTTNGLLPLPKDVRSLPVMTGRDNQYEGYIELKEITGPSSFADGNGVMTHKAVAPVRGRDEAAQPSPVVFDPQGSVVRFPDGTVVNDVTATVLDPGRVPANLPPAQFSSTVVQLTPFGATLEPGGKLTFPNTDGYAANEVVTLYRFDQAAGSNTLGSFVAAGQAQVTADGMRVETASNAIKETTYYFVSKPRRITTIYGRVEEEIEGGAVQPARGALVQVRGQSIFSLTDQSGTFTLRNVPIPDAAVLANGFAIEVSFLRPDGTVDRADREGVIPGIAGLTLVTPPIRIVTAGRTGAPVIQAPKSLTVEAGKLSEFNFLAYARTAGRTLTNVQVVGEAFATVASLGNDRYVLRLAPEATVTGTFTLELRATDSAGEMTSQIVLLEVIAVQANTPVAFSRSIETNEDQAVNVMLTGTEGNLFRVISDPRRGRLTGAVPNLVYTPEADFNGTDAFSFVVGNGTAESAPAVVTINVRPVSDAPILTVGDRFTTNIGQRLAIVINGYDGDAEQVLTLVGAGLPAGALIRQTTATSWVLEWRPTSEQIGTYVVNLILSDNGAPVQTASKSIVITIVATWASSVMINGDSIPILALVNAGDTIIAGTEGEGAYRSLDNGATWSAANNGLPADFDMQALTLKGGAIFVGTFGAGIYRSLDNGTTWSEAGNGLTGFARTVLSLTSSTEAIFAGTFRSGVYRSLDNGATWSTANAGLPTGSAGSVKSLTVSGGVVFAGTNGAGIYRSADNGMTWSAANTGLPAGSARIVLSLAVSGGVVIAGTDGAGIYRSTDNGATWIDANSGLPAGIARAVNALTVGGGAVFAGTQAGVFRSQNNGSAWSEANTGLPTGDGRVVISLTTSSGAIFAGTMMTGVFRSSDNGATWNAASAGLPAGFARLVQSLTANGGTVLAGTLGVGIFRSLDNGATWLAASNGLPEGLARSVYSLASSAGAVFAGTFGAGIYRSLDDGVTWSAANTGLPTGDTRKVVALTTSGTMIFAGTDRGGIYRSTNNGASWSEANTGLATGDARVLRSLTANAGAVFAGTLEAGIFRSLENGAMWSAANNGLPEGEARTVRALTAGGGVIFAGTDAGIFRSFDNGATWSAANNGLPEGDARLVRSLTTRGGAVFAGTSAGVYRSADDGATWNEINKGLTEGGGRLVSAMTSSGGAVFAGTSGAGTFALAESAIVWEPRSSSLTNPIVNAAVFDIEASLVGTSGGGVFRSLDDGLSWIPASAGLPPNARVQALTRASSGIFGGLLGAGVYLTSDQGQTWTARNNGLTNLRVRALALDGATLYAGTEGGVFRSSDQGANWTAVNTGLADLRVLALAVADATIYAGTENGLFRSNDQGANWTAANTGLGNLYVLSLGTAPDGNAVLAGTANGLYRSTNGGGSWTLVSNGISDRVVALAFAVNGPRLLAGTLFGYYVSEDGGASWRPRNTGLFSLQVGALAVRGEQVFAGTRGAGVFVSRLE
ncbi:MAG: hypothetical protein KIT57_24505 [Blastocatellales bacterium]|nr:hypothetical protein [Blastocatellales bacterium]